MFGSDKARVGSKSSCTNRIVVIALAELGATQFVDFETTTLDAKIALQALHLDDSVRNALQLKIVGAAFGSAIVEQQHRTVTSGEVALERQYLTAILERVTGQHTKFGEGVEDHSLRVDDLDLLQDRGDGVSQFHFRWMEDGVLCFGTQILVRRNHLVDIDRCNIPPMRTRNLLQLNFRLGEGDIDPSVSDARPFQEELESQRCLPGTRVT